MNADHLRSKVKAWIEANPAIDSSLMTEFLEFLSLPGLTQCQGIPDSRCNYTSTCGRVCNKCGQVHNGRPYRAPYEFLGDKPVGPANTTFDVTDLSKPVFDITKD